MLQIVGAALALILTIPIPRSVVADIIEWVDSSGTRHFTNQKDDVPPAQQARARRKAGQTTAAGYC